jgi:hypothetical protein
MRSNKSGSRLAFPVFFSASNSFPFALANCFSATVWEGEQTRPLTRTFNLQELAITKEVNTAAMINPYFAMTFILRVKSCVPFIS